MNRKLQVLLGAIAVLAIFAGPATVLSHESTHADQGAPTEVARRIVE